MKKEASYQLELSGARFYEEHFVESIFRPWAEIMVKRLNLAASEKLLDIACGTGIVSRVAGSKNVAGLKITGYDLNPGMLQVAREKSVDIEWVQGNAESLPFDNQSFDKVCCQFGLMFFGDKKQSVKEMLRVCRQEGKVLISVWDTIQNNSAYYDLLEIVNEVGGTELGQILKSPFLLGDLGQIENLFQDFNFALETVTAMVKFPSIDYWIDCDVKASPIGQKISKEIYLDLKASANEKLKQYLKSEGRVEFPMSAHLLSFS